MFGNKKHKIKVTHNNFLKGRMQKPFTYHFNKPQGDRHRTTSRAQPLLRCPGHMEGMNSNYDLAIPSPDHSLAQRDDLCRLHSIPEPKGLESEMKLKHL